MHIFEMAPKVATLGECFLAFGASERSLSSVFSKMVPKVAAFLKN